MPIASYAAGLGKMTVISGLGEPLNAEVELLSTTKDELASLSAQIAPAEVFGAQGLERAAVLSGVRVEVDKRADGSPILVLRSSQPINDPFLDMLIQVEWSSGRLLREYTALLDPPGFGDRNGGTAPGAVAEPAMTQETPPGAAAQKITRKGRAAMDTPVGMGEDEQQPGEHVVKKGDTLHAIARQSGIDGVSLEQMLVGLYRANPKAFAGGNMNRLKVGQIMQIPPAEELQAIPQSEAVKEVRVQTADWNAYRNRLAGLVAESAPAVEEPSPQSASGKISAPAEDKSAPPAQGPRDVVKLSKSESDGAAKAGAADAAARIAALQEEATARENAIKESQAKVDSLEKQLQDMQKLLEIKNKALADAQSAAQAPAQPTPEAAQPAVPAPAEPAAPAAAPPQPAPTPAAPAAETQPPKPKKIKRPPPPPQPEPGMLDTVTENPLLLAAGAGGLLALIGGIWLFLRNKRKKGLDSFEQGILTTGGLKPNTVFGNTAGGTVDTGNTSFLTDFGQGATTGMIDTSDVDPIAEAEVYMAYGRDVQAEEILKDALSKDPKRHELHLKLLEIYANRKDTAAFETLAAELYAALGTSDPVWAKIAEMGHRLEPDNPLYSSGAQPRPEPAAPDFDATMIQAAPMSQAAAEDFDLTLGSEEATLDFSLDEPAPAAAGNEEPEQGAESNTLDFDLGGLETPAEPEPAAESAMESTVESTGEPDLPQLDVADLELPAEEPAAAPAAPEGNGLDFDFELPEPAAEENAQLDVADLGLPEMGAPEAEQLPELPQQAPQEAPPAASTAEEALSLDLPALDLGPAKGATEPAPAAEEAVIDLSLQELEMPQEPETTVALEAPQAAPEAPEAAPTLETAPAAAEAQPAFELPEEPQASAPTAETPAETPADSTGLDFDFDLSALEAPETIADAPAPKAELDSPEINMSALSAPAIEPEPEPVASDLVTPPVAPAEPEAEAAPSLDMDLSAFMEASAPAAPEAAPEQPAAPAAAEEPAEAAGLDFDFDIDLGEAPAEPAARETEAAPLPDLDLSGISLDVADVPAQENIAEEITLSAADSPDVDTKLDLVTAYIDMGDEEGARELLQEVLKEGGPTQREKAQKLLGGLA